MWVCGIWRINFPWRLETDRKDPRLSLTVGNRQERCIFFLMVSHRRGSFGFILMVGNRRGRFSWRKRKNRRWNRQGLVRDGFPSGKMYFPRQFSSDGLSLTVTVTEDFPWRYLVISVTVLAVRKKTGWGSYLGDKGAQMLNQSTRAKVMTKWYDSERLSTHVHESLFCFALLQAFPRK